MDVGQAVAVFNSQTDVVGEWVDGRKEEREGGRRPNCEKEHLINTYYALSLHYLH